MRQKFLFCFSALPSSTDQSISNPFTSTSPVSGHRKLAPSVGGKKRQTNFSTHDLSWFSLSFLVQFHAGVACAAVVCLLPFFTSLSSSFGIHSVCLSIYLFMLHTFDLLLRSLYSGGLDIQSWLVPAASMKCNHIMYAEGIIPTASCVESFS